MKKILFLTLSVFGLFWLGINPVFSQNTAYLFTYFTGNKVADESIHFAVSTDGYNYRALNNNAPVIDSKEISSTGGVRDPHILRCQDGKTFYMVVTDMTSSKGWDSNRAMVLLKSKDLVNWTSNVVNIQKRFPGNEDLLRVWAPQTIYDVKVKKYMVYWSMKHGQGPDIIYYAYANADFTDLETTPKQLFFPKEGKSCIDGDIVLKGDTYYMFYKTEGHGDGIKLATTKSLSSGQWTEHEGYKQQTTDAVEGAGVFKLNNSKEYILMYDVYKRGRYQFTKTTDLMNFKAIDNEISMNFHPRHGTVIPITREELDRLVSKWGLSVAKYFPLQDVQLLDGPFKHAQDLDKNYLLELSADRLLAPFLREAGLTPKAESYGNWENTGLDGHIGGHYLSALSLMYASTGDSQIKQRLDYMISELKRCQNANGNGYIGGVPGGKASWDKIAAGTIKAGGFDLDGKWVPLYNIHKTYAGLRDAYLYAGSEDAKEMLIKMTDWAIQLVSNLSDEQIQLLLKSEHGGLNEVFADVAVITGDKKYLTLAKQFSHHQVLDPLLLHEDKLTGMHANTQIPKVIGFKRIADIEGNNSWNDAAKFFWETVVDNRSVCIGGNSAYEHFHPVDDFSKMIEGTQGPETCNTYNMLKLTKMLYQTSGQGKYMDFYERALYNHILSSQNPERGGFVYFTQMTPGHYRVYSQPQTSMWCCVGSGMENHSKYGEMIYAYNGNDLYVNLFVASQLNWKDKNIEIIQQTSFPDKPSTQLIINPKIATDFTMNLRYPLWLKEGSLKVKINGKEWPASKNPEGYVSIFRKWEKGDKVEMEMPMSITVEQLPDHSNYYSIFYGPIVLAAKTGTEDMKGLFADDSRDGHIAHGEQLPLKDMPVIVSNPKKIASLITPVPEKPLTFHLSGLSPKKYASGFELIPFFRLHESRYIIYWPQEDSK